MNNEKMLLLEFPDEQKSTGPVTCLSMTFENDEKLRVTVSPFFPLHKIGANNGN